MQHAIERGERPGESLEALDGKNMLHANRVCGSCAMRFASETWPRPDCRLWKHGISFINRTEGKDCHPSTRASFGFVFGTWNWYVFWRQSSRPRGSVGIAALLCRWQTGGGGSIPRWSAGKTQDRRPAERQRARTKKSFLKTELGPPLLFVSCTSVWIDLAKAKRRWTQKNGFDADRLVVTVITRAERSPLVMGFRLLDDDDNIQPALQVEERPHAGVAAPLAPENVVACIDIVVLVVQLVSRHSCVADRLPVVVRFPAGPRVRLKTVDPPKGNGLGQKKSSSLYWHWGWTPWWRSGHSRSIGDFSMQERQKQSNNVNLLLRSWQNPQMRKRSSFTIWLTCLTRNGAQTVLHRARPDRHHRDGTVKDSGVPTVSFDFAYTKAVEPGG